VKKGEKDALEVPLQDESLELAKKQVSGVAEQIRAREFDHGPKKKNGNDKHRCPSCDFLGFCGMKEAHTHRETV
jgi:DNA helicase-2/ATP-dependent DNA helicase PcrA